MQNNYISIIKFEFFTRIYLNFSFVSLVSALFIGFFILIWHTFSSKKFSTVYWLNFFEKGIYSIQYILIFFSVLLFSIFYKTKQHYFSSTLINDSHKIFFFTINELSLFFILMLYFVIILTMLTYKYTIMDEVNCYIKNNKRIFNDIKNQTYFNFMMIILQFQLFMFFTTENIFIFFIAFETSIIPIFFITGFYGKRAQKFRAMSYLLYFTLVSAIPFIFILLYFYITTGCLFYPEFELLVKTKVFSNKEITIAFLSFFIPFGVKFAFFPFHTWLPEAHVESSTEGSMLLSGILLKLGFYGIIKYCLLLFVESLFGLSPFLLTFAFIGAFTTSLSTYKQVDIKKIIAYSSVVHMNISLFGYFTISSLAIEAALFLTFSHALISAGLFCLIGILQDRTRTRNIFELSGLSNIMPIWSNNFLILLLANSGFPGTCGFIGEACLIWGCFMYFPYSAFLLFFPMTIMSFRNFLLYTQLCWGTAPAFFEKIKVSNNIYIFRFWDITINKEGLVPSILCILILVFGVWPNILLFWIEYIALQIEIQFI